MSGQEQLPPAEATASAFTTPVNVEALKSEIRSALINHKAIACPMSVRLAWHASGTYAKVRAFACSSRSP